LGVVFDESQPASEDFQVLAAYKIFYSPILWPFIHLWIYVGAGNSPGANWRECYRTLSHRKLPLAGR